MTTPYQRWIERDPARHGPEVDFGTQWTSDRRPHEMWRVSWNSGSGELVAVTHAGDEVEVLGQFDSADDVTQALPHWARQALHPGGLDDVRLALAERRRALTEPQPPPPVYGMVIEPDGSTRNLHEPITAQAAARHIGTDVLDVARVRPERAENRRGVMMWVDDLGHTKGLPVNPVATQLYGTGWPIVGTAVVFDDGDAELPRSISEGLAGAVSHMTTPCHVDVDEAEPGIDGHPDPADWDLS